MPVARIWPAAPSPAVVPASVAASSAARASGAIRAALASASGRATGVAATALGPVARIPYADHPVGAASGTIGVGAGDGSGAGVAPPPAAMVTTPSRTSGWRPVRSR
ncbi:hypothetical protein BFL35_04750 [Clavibacter michiganensis]|nr:hypothetical protein BFL35_04750 [Clavibacter michiganensis]